MVCEAVSQQVNDQGQTQLVEASLNVMLKSDDESKVDFGIVVLVTFILLFICVLLAFGAYYLIQRRRAKLEQKK